MIFWGNYVLKYVEFSINQKNDTNYSNDVNTKILRAKLSLIDSIKNLIKNQNIMLDGILFTMKSYDPVTFSRKMREINQSDIQNISKNIYDYGLLFRDINLPFSMLTSIQPKSLQDPLPNAILRQEFIQLDRKTYTEIEMKISLPENDDVINFELAYENVKKLIGSEHDYTLEKERDDRLKSIIKIEKYGNININQINNIIAPLKKSKGETIEAYELLKNNIISKYELKDYFFSL